MARTVQKPRPVFFISHSSAGLPAGDRTVQIRECLASELENRGWDVFLDRRVLQPGDRWRTNIIYGLSSASAAAVLFNDDAIAKSSWVTAETLILCFHKSVDPLFRLVPVMLEGHTLQETEFGKYQPFELNEIQAFPDDGNLPPTHVAKVIADRFDIEQVCRERSRWCTRVASLLAKIRSTATLDDIARQLELEVDAATRIAPPELVIEQLKNAIVLAMHHREPLACVDAISEMFLPLSDSERVLLKRHVLAKWVPNESVEVLMAAVRRVQDIGVLTIDVMGRAAVDQYINRSKIELHRGTVWAFSVSAATGASDEAIIADVEDAIRQYMAPEPFYYGDGNEMPLPEAIQEEVMTSHADAAICVLPASCSRESVIRELRRRYKSILFLVQTGSSGVKFSEAFNTRALTPPLTPTRKNELSQLMSRVEAALTAANLM